MNSYTNRIIVLVDMDCFYCQVEEKLDPSLAGKPIAVVQYNAWKGGGLIAVNYPARDKGVTRHMRGDEAKEKCPDIELVSVPTVRGKADLTKYREGGKRVAEVLQTFTPLLQRASVDEAYLDITEAVNNRLRDMDGEITLKDLEHTYVVGCDTKDFIKCVYNNELHNEDNLKLLMGGVIVEEIRAAVYDKTDYKCSAGIAHNKILAKLACGMNKPNKQTILPDDSVEGLYKNLSIKKIKSLGGKFGNSLAEDLNIKYMSELAKFSEKDLLKKYDDKTALWLYNIARGIDTEPVETRLISKSIGCCKRFPGKTALTTVEDVTHWLSELAEELSERLEQDLQENNRKARQVVVSFAQEINRKDIHNSRTQILNSYDAKKIAEDTYETIRKNTQKSDGSYVIKFLGLSAGKFDSVKNFSDISSFFKQINKDEYIDNVRETRSTIECSDSLGETVKEKYTNQFKNGKSVKSKSSILNFLNVSTKSTDTINVSADTLNINKTSDNMDETSNEHINETQKHKNSIKVNTYNILNEELNLNDIENDANISTDNLGTINESAIEDNFSDSTVEIDYSEILETKREFRSNINNNHFSHEENSSDSNISGKTSPILGNLENSNSFFMRYVKKFETKNSNNAQSSYENNDLITVASTSKVNEINILKNYDSETGNSNEIYDQCSGELPIEIIYSDNSNSSVSKIDENKENMYDICPECNERIPKSNFTTHMDHHMARKLMEEEKKLFQEELEIEKQKRLKKSPVKQNKNIRTSKQKKRKLNQSENSVAITTFLIQKSNTNNSESENCPECGKQINLSELNSHLDFHAAKKLHLKLNPVKFAGQSIPVNKKKDVSGVQSLANFFKPL